MKKVTKLFLSVAAISVFAAGLATSAMAMTAEYDATTGKVTITAEQGDQVASTEKTLLILNNDAVTVTEADIVQIDQSEDISEVPVGELADGTYYVRVGGDGNIDVATFTVGGDSPYEDPTRLLGNVNSDIFVDGGDADYLVNVLVGVGTLEGDAKQAADVNDDSYVDGGDADYLVNFLVGLNGELEGKTLADKVNYVVD